MRVPEPRSADLRVLGRTLVGLLALVACASNPPEPVQRGAAPQAAPVAEAPALAAPIVDASAAGIEELEASLAAYEQQLAASSKRGVDRPDVRERV